jgi:hypothetical protein
VCEFQGYVRYEALGSVSIPLDDAVERRITMFGYLATAKTQRPTFRSYASQRNMNMRMLGIEVGGRYPFETRAEIGLHL